jgi:hypothetical protein
MTLVLDAATSRAKDTWTGAAVVREHEPEKQAIATPILELYDRLGTFSPKR